MAPEAKVARCVRDLIDRGLEQRNATFSCFEIEVCNDRERTHEFAGFVRVQPEMSSHQRCPASARGAGKVPDRESRRAGCEGM